MPLAIDVSNYTGPISPEQAEALKAAGVGRVIVQIVDPPPGYPPTVFRQQIPALIEAGLEIEAYVYLWLAGDTDARVRWAEAEIAPWRERIGRMWLDVEDVTVPEDQDANRRAVEAAVAACRMPAGIYSAGWYWRPYMGDTAAFAHLPLWVAEYDGVASLDFTPFGGWSACAMKQHIGESQIAGLGGLDQNWYEAGMVPLPGGEFLPEPEVSDAAAFYRAIRLGAQSDVDVTVVPASRPGWNAWRVEVKED